MFMFSLTGDKELDKTLSKMQPKNVKNLIVAAARQSAKTTLEVAKSTFPKGTGIAAASMAIKAGSRKGEKHGYFGVRIWTGTREKLGIDPKNKFYYPAAVEFGTEKTPARGTIRAAVNSTRAQVQEGFANAIRNALEKMAKRYAKQGKVL